MRQSLDLVWLSQSMRSILYFCVQLSQRLQMHQETGKLITTHLTQTDAFITTTTTTTTGVFPSRRLSCVFALSCGVTVWINLLCILSKVIPFPGSVFALSLCNMERNAQTPQLDSKVPSTKSGSVLNAYLPSFVKHIENENIKLLIFYLKMQISPTLL